MMINGFMPRMPFLSSPIAPPSIVPGRNTALNAPPPITAPELTMNNALNASSLGLAGTGLPGWNAGSLFNPLGNAMNSVGRFGSQLFGGLGNALSGLGQMGPVTMPGLPSLSTPFTQPLLATPAMPTLSAPRPPVLQSLSNGAGQALKDVGNVLKKNTPAALAFGGAMMSGCAVCAFMGGTLAATGGILMGNQMMQAPANHPV